MLICQWSIANFLDEIKGRISTTVNSISQLVCPGHFQSFTGTACFSDVFTCSSARLTAVKHIVTSNCKGMSNIQGFIVSLKLFAKGKKGHFVSLPISCYLFQMKPCLRLSVWPSIGQGSLEGGCYVLKIAKRLLGVAYLLPIDCSIANCISYGLVFRQNYSSYGRVQPILFRNLS